MIKNKDNFYEKSIVSDREKMLEEMEKHLSKEPTLHVRGDLTNNRNDIQEVYDNRQHL